MLPINRPQDIAAFEAGTECYLCGNSFDESPVITADATQHQHGAIVQWMKDNSSLWRSSPDTFGEAIKSMKEAENIFVERFQDER